MLGNCNARDYAINKSRMVRLAEFSRDCLIELRAATGIRYDERSRARCSCSARKASWRHRQDMAVLKADGVPFEVLDKAGCIAAEPGLAASHAPCGRAAPAA
jgi:D-amino-acid dehydrogenase